MSTRRRIATLFAESDLESKKMETKVEVTRVQDRGRHWAFKKERSQVLIAKMVKDGELKQVMRCNGVNIGKSIGRLAVSITLRERSYAKRGSPTNDPGRSVADTPLSSSPPCSMKTESLYGYSARLCENHGSGCSRM